MMNAYPLHRNGTHRRRETFKRRFYVTSSFSTGTQRHALICLSYSCVTRNCTTRSHRISFVFRTILLHWSFFFPAFFLSFFLSFFYAFCLPSYLSYLTSYPLTSFLILAPKFASFSISPPFYLLSLALFLPPCLV
jgi:hypothetical protein